MIPNVHSNNFVHRWFNPNGKDKVISVLIIGALIAGISFLVYFTGGTSLAYPHLMYIPIILSALFFRLPGGILAAVVSGFILGPMMPLNSLTGEMQPLTNWLVRIIFYMVIGTLAGGIFSLLDKGFKKNEWQMNYDSLTKLPNRSYLTSQLQKIIEDSGQNEKHAVVIFLINNSHEISNLFGLDYADNLLMQISDRIKKLPAETPLCFLASSVCGLVVNYEDQKQLEEDIINSYEHLVDISFILDNIPVFLDISIGVALYPKNFHNPNMLIRKAQSAAYTAHKKGLNCWYFKDQEGLNKETLALLGSIQGSLRNNRFLLHYQPIIDLTQQKVVGLEALVRWDHPEFGMIPPINFLPKAETTSLIYQVQEWVFRNAFIEVFEMGVVENDLYLSINLSARGLANYYQLGSPFYRLIDEYNIESERIVLEITETTIMIDENKSFKALRQLRDYGVKIAIDDFGSGYSSLNYIKEIPANFLKIDQKFVRELHLSEKDQEIVRAILSISNTLGFNTIAEGIEDERTLQWLKSEGCQYAQGYYIAHPMPISELPAWFEEFNSKNFKPINS